VKKINHPGAATLADPFLAPAHLADAAGLRNDIARFGIAGDVVNELIVLAAAPDLFSLTNE
jgi:hypothetical protein